MGLLVNLADTVRPLIGPKSPRGVTELPSEDFQRERLCGTVQAVNPFLVP